MPLILVYRETFVSLAYVVNLWSCWNSGYELDIVATTRSNRVCQSFSFSLSLSTELLEDKQGFKLGGVDTSPSYLLFQTLLPLFWTLICMIWMELTRTDAVFSRIAMVLFCEEIKVLRMSWKFTKICSGIKEKYLHKDPPEEVDQWATSPQAAATPLTASWELVGPMSLHRPQTRLYIFRLARKKPGEKVSSRFAIRRRRHILFFIWRADLESISGSGEGKSSPSSSSTFLHRQFHDALHRSWVISS